MVASAVEGGHHVGNGRLSSEEVSDPSQRPAAETGGRGTASTSDISWIVTIVVTVYALVTGVFLVSENRSPQATLAWMLAFILASGLGVLIYFLFGRDTKAFSRRRTLLQQDLAARAPPAAVADPVPPGYGH